ncbi:hypothetical protein THTE_4195 [Thermogutta terrifontis]|uniref:Uncharacterized protein n=1 Tax=Thermogutta terrifontis TaxID=1331910 RepID=A0A286RLG4_9BACT|nr:hypothetical protein THTE_4195 [Thermogutta terrifontis]
MHSLKPGNIFLLRRIGALHGVFTQDGELHGRSLKFTAVNHR